MRALLICGMVLWARERRPEDTAIVSRKDCTLVRNSSSSFEWVWPGEGGGN